MSVKALDDSRKQIDIPDELESFFHVMLYEACQFLDNTCVSLEEFMSRYFDDSHRHKLDFYCGGLKRNTMLLGEIRCPEGNPFHFIQSRPKKPLPARAPPPSKNITTSLSPIAEASDVSPASDAPVDEGALVLHPIQTILSRLLGLFKAHYVGHQYPDMLVRQPTSLAARAGAKPKDDSLQDIEAGLNAPKNIDNDGSSQSPATLAETAALLETHDQFTHIVLEVYKTFDWPPHDKLTLQIDSQYKKNVHRFKREDFQEDEHASKKRTMSPSAS